MPDAEGNLALHIAARHGICTLPPLSSVSPCTSPYFPPWTVDETWTDDEAKSLLGRIVAMNPAAVEITNTAGHQPSNLSCRSHAFYASLGAYLARYRLQLGEPMYCTSTSTVWAAVDTVVPDAKELALKLMHDETQFRNEISHRLYLGTKIMGRAGEQCAALIPAVRVHVPERRIAEFSEEFAGMVGSEPSQSENDYVVVMPLADRNLVGHSHHITLSITVTSP